MQIEPAASVEDFVTVRGLMREYQAQVGTNLCFQDFEAELATLPGAYGPPHGRLLLATHEGAAVGCVALRSFGAGRAEMKRLFVRSPARGLGVGKALLARVVVEARASGYTELVLDTLPSMAAAQGMYEKAGFRDIAPYTANPVAGARYLGLSLVHA